MINKSQHYPNIIDYVDELINIGDNDILECS